MRKVLALALCFLFLLPVMSASAPRAADSYLITIAEDTVLRDTGDNEMAVYIDGIIYVPYTVLKKMDSVFVSYNEAEALVTVFRIGSQMQFELDTGRTYDTIQQREISISAVMRGKVPYLPVSVVSAWMGMYFSFTSAAQSGVGYPVIRLASSTPAVSDTVVMARNRTRMREIAEERDFLNGGGTVEQLKPERDIALLFCGLPAENARGAASDIMTTLEGFSMPAAFFLTEEQVLANADCVREIYGRSFLPGVLVKAEGDAVQQAQAASEAYAQVLHLRVRIVCGETALTAEQKTALEAEGFVVWQGQNPQPAPELTARKLTSEAKRWLREAPEQSAVQFPVNAAVQEALPVLCSYLVSQNFVTKPAYDWVKPF